MTPETLAKVPAVTLGFWIIKILATTLGETGGDTVTMTMNLRLSRPAPVIFLIARCSVLVVASQIRAKTFHPLLYWATIVASTTAGTTLADFADRSLGIGYPGGSARAARSACSPSLCAVVPRRGHASRSNTVNTPRVEAFYWATITFSQTLGTALGDWMADDTGLGYAGGALVFGAALARRRGCLLLDHDLARRPVLGRVHPHPAARRHGRRLSRQADRRRRPRAEPPGRLARPGRRDARAHLSAAAARGRASAEPQLVSTPRARPAARDAPHHRNRNGLDHRAQHIFTIGFRLA